MAQSKAAALKSAWGGLPAAELEQLVVAHARQRRSAEAAEGLSAFAEKRAPDWSKIG
jgi:enoyl-CoA hydratase/carnithine racemase